MWAIFATVLALATLQPQTAATGTTDRTEAQAQIDVCLYTPPGNRDPACEPLLRSEAALVPDDAFGPGVSDSLAWSNRACTDGGMRTGPEAVACRREQGRLYRRAERARQALGAGTADGLYAESQNYTTGPATSAASDVQGNAFGENRRRVGENCEQESRASRDEDTGSSSSSFAFSCTYGNNDEATRDSLNAVRDRLFGD